VVFVSPEKYILLYSFVLTQLCSNNVVEYQALNLSLEMAIGTGITDPNIYGDSQLVINQLLDEYEVNKEDIVPYHRQVLRLLNKLDMVKLEHVPRTANKMADALVSLTATLALGAEGEMTIPVYSHYVVPPDDEDSEEDVNMICVLETDSENWRNPIIEYLEHGKLPSDPMHKTEIQRRASSCLYYNKTLYRRSLLGLWLRCLDVEEAKQGMT